jgi:hypothetical protein
LFTSALNSKSFHSKQIQLKKCLTSNLILLKSSAVKKHDIGG